MRILLATIAALALTAAPSPASPLSKERAHARAYGLLEQDQIADLFDMRPIVGWQMQPASECARVSARTVRCAFVVRREPPLQDCGATLTMRQRSWYIGWTISTHPGPQARCSPRAAQLAMGPQGRRGIDTVWG